MIAESSPAARTSSYTVFSPSVITTRNEDTQQAVGLKPPFSFSISTPSLSNGGGATT
jgi:hypothetical protein